MILGLASIAATRPLVTSPVLIFLIVLAIILLVPMALNRLKIPHVIGMILAGVVVGPYGANILAYDMSFQVFGQVGLLYLMFLAGVEIDMYHFRKNLQRGIVFGAFTFFVPMVVGVVSTLVFLHTDVLTALLMASMFAAHTLLAYPIVSRFGLTKNRAVIIAVAGTVFTVLGSLLVLAGTVSAVRDGEFNILAVSRLVAGLFIYCVAGFYLYPRLTRWFFRRYNDTIAQFAYILVMVFLAAECAAWIGLEGVFGAFFAGILLNRFIPARSPLMGRLEFVGNALFIPYFLIGVGMMINLRAIFAGWQTLYIAAVMCATAMAGKWIAAYFTQKTFGMRGVERSILYQLSNAHTAVALAVVTIGYDLGIFDSSILNATVVMILVTCTVSSIGTANAARKLKLSSVADVPAVDEKEARNHRQQINTLVPVVNEFTAKELVSLALMMHDVRPGGHNAFFALHVRNDNSTGSRSVGQSSLKVAEQTAASMDVPLSTIERYDLNFVTGVLNTMAERDINEVVIGLHRRTASVVDSFFGDKLMQLLEATNRMVVISRCYIPVNTMRRIMVVVPDKAQFETGFVRWVKCIGNLGRQLGCRAVFHTSEETARSIEAVLKWGQYGVRHEYVTMEAWDDMVLLANKVYDDDLFVSVVARNASVSYDADMSSLPEFLRKYFAQNNIMVIYPEQFGAEAMVPAMADAISGNVAALPSGTLLVRLALWWRRLRRG